MSYQVLARKWRPKAFNEVVGQEHVLKVLSNALSLGRVHHAYLFSGTRGVGKTSIARLLAKGLNCERGVTATPCGKCDNCADIEQGRFVDLLEIDAASRTKVEDTRDILDNIQYLPTKGRFKVYLIDEVHMLSRSSFNALLKTLEEPPEHVKFLLATTDPQKLPVTILSRCLHLHLHALDSELIIQQLIKILHAEAISAEKKAIQLLAKSANGSMRDALSLTDQAIALGNGVVDTESVSQMLGTLDPLISVALVEALYQGDGTLLMECIENAAKQGADWDSLLTDTIALLHQISLLQIVPSSMRNDQEHEDKIRYLAQYIAPNDIQLYYQILLMGRKELAYAPDKKIGVEMSFLRALAFVPKNLNHVIFSEGGEQSRSHTQSSTLAKTDEITTRQPTQTRDIQAQDKKNNDKSIVKDSQALPILKRTHSPEGKREQLAPSPIAPETELEGASSVTKNILAVRQQLIESEKNIKKSELVERSQPNTVLSTINIATSTKSKSGEARLNDRMNHLDSDESANTDIADSTMATAETYQWQFSEHFTPNSDPSLNAKSVRLSFEHEKTHELTQKLIQEAAEIDSWSAEIEALTIPPLVKQLAVNAYIEQESDNKIILHLRSPVAHLTKTSNSLNKLSDALSLYRKKTVELTVIIDDNVENLTPLEVREKIYQSKLAQAKNWIHQDNKVALICQLFDAQIDEESIRPV